MIRKFVLASTCLIAFFTLSFSVIAGQLYRFPDENGVLTLSRSLPPEAAQKGYDILDDDSMRLIQRVAPAPTADEIAEMETQKAVEIERQKRIELEAQEAEKQRAKQARIDRTLLVTYSTEKALIKARDKELNYRKEQIETYKSKLPDLKENLVEIQKEAADRELGGGKITTNMQKRLDAAHEEIEVRKKAIERFQAEIDVLAEKYESDLRRLRYLLGKQANN
ncbi:DUF4124 domain-containing protein [Methylophaga sp.]|uniref:DUF4124 domain-containing protein n=1 Tax=Methylophaga sp. TaxID=2024840 RepID=UPI003F69A361